MSTRAIELVYFSGCPNAGAARDNIKQALAALRLPATFAEWDQLDASAPERIRQYGSPTVLVDGRDITGVGAVEGATCRAEGAPSVETIKAALAAAR